MEGRVCVTATRVATRRGGCGGELADLHLRAVRDELAHADALLLWQRDLFHVPVRVRVRCPVSDAANPRDTRARCGGGGRRAAAPELLSRTHMLRRSMVWKYLLVPGSRADTAWQIAPMMYAYVPPATKMMKSATTVSVVLAG